MFDKTRCHNDLLKYQIGIQFCQYKARDRARAPPHSPRKCKARLLSRTSNRLILYRASPLFTFPQNPTGYSNSTSSFSIHSRKQIIRDTFFRSFNLVLVCLYKVLYLLSITSDHVTYTKYQIINENQSNGSCL